MSDLLELYEQASPQPDLTNVRETLVPMLDGLSRALGYERALVALYQPHRGVLRGTVGLNVPESIAESLEVALSSEDNPIVQALLQGTPQRVDDVVHDDRFSEHSRELLRELGMTSFVVAPLRSSGDGLGAGVIGGEGAAERPGGTWEGNVLPAQGVVLLSKEQRITDQDIDWLMPFANQAGVALARATDVEFLRSSSEQAAIENEWLRWMLDAVDDPVVVTDSESNNIVQRNRRAETLFLASPDDSEGKKHALRLNNFLFTAAVSTWNLEQGSDAEQPVGNRELTLADPIEGSELLFEVLTTPMTHYRLGKRGLVSVLKNVTDLRRATEQLTENVQLLQSADEEIRLERDRLDLILRSVPNPIVVIDVVENTNQIVRMNREASRLLQGPALNGRSGAAAEGRSAQMALSNEARFTSFLAQLRLDPAQSKSGELSLLDPDTEETRPMWVTCAEMRDDLGGVSGMVALMMDLSDLRELEARRIEQALFESEKLAVQGQMAAQIAHEINNPLEAVKNALYLLTNKIARDDPNHKFLEIALKETTRVSRIVGETLGLYRQAAAMAPMDVNLLIDEAEALFGATLKQKGIRMYKELSPDMPPVVCSGDQIKQVILNMLINASQATLEGGSIFISTHATNDAAPDFLRSRAVYIQIRDTGVGMTDEVLAHLFEPFFSTKRDKGTGLGLWVSNGIVRSHGGDIKVRSRPGRGTTFTITLPIEGPPPDAQG